MDTNTIYLVTCLITYKQYVGQTWSKPNERWSDHKRDARRHQDKCRKLCGAIRKYGENNFLFEPLVVCFSQTEADVAEIYFIKLFDTIKNGYNIREGGSRGKLSKESRKRLSQSRMGSKNPMYGRPVSAETKKKLSDAGKKHPGNTLGKRHSDATKKKMSEAKQGERSPFAKLNDEKVREIKLLLKEGKSYRFIAQLYGVDETNIGYIARGKTWTHIE